MIVNGQQQRHITIADRALQYGDGCFTTMAFRKGHIELFDAHVARLKLACKTLCIDFDKWSELVDCVFDSLRSTSDCVIKVMITRGEGGRGYNPEGAVNPTYIISQHPLPPQYPLWQSKGISLTISPVTLAKQPLLAGIKHLNRLEQVLIKQKLTKTDFDDAVVCDTQQQIVETSAGNLFWYKENVWFTADLSESGVEGVMRNHIVAVMQEYGLECRVVKQDIRVLFSAQELFVCNSLMMLVPVTTLVDPNNQNAKRYVIDQTKHLQQYVLSGLPLKAIRTS
ncbi:aminodeoxychorismate lyase [uncultured Paraglaciecola sp.]|uniref:aminodeoxychorismate lyase n=1 Tax=uncultured Paraglaciecola sp. TaxID=1765024 RepID=UPI0030DBD63F|tara:strand:- start:258802 stop:259647 length:846 start_codon:yes stop_codon:yes gene_type:complete